MGKFRKKPVVIDAVRFTGVNSERMHEISQFAGYTPEVRDIDNVLHLVIPTLEGDHLARPGDWIIKGVAGELYPCKPEIFSATYDAVGGDE